MAYIDFSYTQPDPNQDGVSYSNKTKDNFLALRDQVVLFDSLQISSQSFTYINDKISEVINTYLDNNSQLKISYTYNNDDTIQQSTYYYRPNQTSPWEQIGKRTYVYDSNSNLISTSLI